MVVGVAGVGYGVVGAGPVGVQLHRSQGTEFVVDVVGQGFAAAADDLVHGAQVIVLVVQGIPLVHVGGFGPGGYPAVVVVVQGYEVHAGQVKAVGVALDLAGFFGTGYLTY